MVGAGLHRGVDLLDRAEPLLVGADRVEQVRHEQAVDDEAGLVLRVDSELAELLAELEAGRERFLVGRHGLDDLEQRHHLSRVEEMEADEPLGPLGRGRLVDHRQRRRVGGEHRAVLDDAVELLPHLELHPEVLGDRLDHEIAVGEVAVVERAVDAAADGLGVGLLHSPLLDGPRELFFDPSDPLVETLLVDLAEHDVVAGLSGDLGDAMAHQARAEHAHLRDLH